MIDQNRTKKYLLYAIGEIILVVIGILIALQINNWNEDRKARAMEIVILENLKTDLTLDTLDINFNLKYYKQFIDEEKKLLNFLTSDLDTPETPINYNAALTTPLIIVLHESTFNNLQNNSIGIITNNSLQKDISRFYDFFSKGIKIIENELSSYETYDVKLPYFLKYFQLDPNGKLMVLSNEKRKDYYNPNFEKQAIILNKVSEAKQDEGFKVLLNESIFFRQVTIDFYIDMISRIKELDIAITNELEILRSE
ncbi:DUF6090 family protein [Croceiramulus getboli]|nr:DUF6090 family protein [Flavobacteriaceae bacterium YJPT1-3]